MKIISSFFILFLTLILLTSCETKTNTTQHCFLSTAKDGTQTYIIIESYSLKNFPDTNGRIIIRDFKDGKEIYSPQKTPGRLTENSFTYADGTKFIFDNKELTLPVNRLFKGEKNPKVDCDIVPK